MIFNGSYVFSTIYCQFSMLFNGNFIFVSIFHVILLLFCMFFLFFVNFPCYSMENVHFSIVYKFSMLFNGKFASCHFPMLFNVKFAFCQFHMLFNGNLRIKKLRGGRGRGRTDVHKEIHPCVLQDIGPLGPLPKKVPKVPFSDYRCRSYTNTRQHTVTLHASAL